MIRLLASIGLLEVALWWLSRLLGRRFEWRAAAYALFLATICLWPWLRGPELMVPSDILLGSLPGTHRTGPVSAHASVLNDAIFQFIPWELEVRHALSAGRLPLWSDAIDGGSSPWVNLQAGALSPHAMLARPLPIQHHLLGALFLKIVTAIQGAWLLGRCLGLRLPARLVLATGYGFGGPIAAWGLFAHSAVAAWIPWLAAALICLLRPRRRGAVRPACAAAALTTAALLLSGQPEVAVSGVLLATLTAFSVRRRRGARRAPLAALALAGLLGAALAAAQLVPFAAALPHSIRAQEHAGQSGAIRGARGTTPTGFDPARVALLRAPTGPHVFGVPFREVFRGPIVWPVASWSYVGIAAFLGLVAIFVPTRSRWWRAPAVALGLLAVTLTLLAAGFRPLERLVLATPLLRLPEYTRLLSGAALALAILGAFGLQALWQRSVAWRVIVGGCAAAISVGLAPTPWTIGLWILLGLALSLPPKRARARLGLLALVVGLDGLAWCRLFQPRTSPDSFFPLTTMVQELRSETTQGPWRVIAADRLAYPATLAPYGLDDPRHHNPLADGDYASVLGAVFGFRPSTTEYFAALRNLEHPLLDFLNVRLVASNRYLPPLERLRPVSGERPEPWLLYRNPQALPRWFVPDRVDIAPRREIVDRLVALADARTVMVAAEDLGSRSGTVIPAPGAVELRSLTPGKVVLRIEADRDTVLATSLAQPRGWSATAAAGGLEIVPVNLAFTGVRVPAGTAELTLVYRPPWLAIGIVLTALALAVCAALASTVPPAAGARRLS